jgi:hypothetical protein
MEQIFALLVRQFFGRICYTKTMKPSNILGLIIFFAGLLAIAGFGLYKFFEDSTISIVVRLGIIAIILGIIIILTSLIRERLKDKNL